MEKFKDFLKYNKESIIGFIYLCGSVYLFGLIICYIKVCNIDIQPFLIILFLLYFVFKFLEKGYELLFEKK